MTAKTVVLTDTHNGQTVGATVTYDATSKTATLHPKALLGTHVKYRVSLTKDIKDWKRQPPRGDLVDVHDDRGLGTPPRSYPVSRRRTPPVSSFTP